MKVTMLLENRTQSKELICEHGLSLYVETAKHKILFDMGQTDAFAKNAEKLGIDLKTVDLAILSHGHYDHGGGLKTFLEINNHAKIYVSKDAFKYKCVKILNLIKYDIGLDQNLKDNDRLVFVKGITKIDNELTLFNGITGKELVPPGNKTLYRKDEQGEIVSDDFEHEINLLINEEDKYSLLCGCAHKGIVNIVDKAREITNQPINHVIGGFHIRRIEASDKNPLMVELINQLSNKDVGTYYTCHCTGEKAYNYMSHHMDNIQYIMTGNKIEL